MTDLFLDILNLSFSATWVVLAVVLARFLLKKAPRWMVCGLWALVALRLVFGGFEAPFSLIPSSEIIPPESLYDQAPTIHSGISSLDNAVNPIYSESLRPTPGASVNPLQVWLAVFANLWVLGMAAMALWAGISCFRVRRRTAESIPTETGVYLCDRITSPFIFGLFLPRIYLPSGLDGASRDHVIAHEKAHLRRRDHWWKPLGFLLLTVNWFNPAMWLAYVLLCRDIELACDEKVVRNFTTEEKKAYSAALLRCSVNARPITACPLAFGEVGVKQRVRSVLHYKKPAFWILLAAVVVTLVLAVGLLTDPSGRTSEIRCNGHLYVLMNPDYSFLPAEEPIGTLRSILHRTDAHPTEDFQATNLDESLAGCPLYLENDLLFLLKYDGSCMAFQLQTAAESLTGLLKDRSCSFSLSLHPGPLQTNEVLSGQAADDLAEVLRQATKTHWTAAPTPDWATYAVDSDVWVAADSETCEESFMLIRSGSYGWVCVSSSREAGDRAFFLDGTKLDGFVQPYLSEVTALTDCFPLPGTNQALLVRFQTFESQGIVFRAATPWMDFGSPPVLWHTEALENAPGFRSRPAGSESWMEIRFPDTAQPGIGSSSEQIVLANGIKGTLYYTDDAARWDQLRLDTTRGLLQVTVKDGADWTPEDYRMALAIASSLSVTEKGASLLACPDGGEEAELGIALRGENVTPNGATLVCTQDGTLWDEITTGAPWGLERCEDGQWVSIMPESTVWTTIAYGLKPGQTTSWNLDWTQMVGTLEPGQYRVSKNFRGVRRPMFTLGLETEEVWQTCFAEFTIE